MQIVIEIDEDTYKDIKRGKIYTSVRDVPQESVVAIANGTPLPKGHGKLIDVDSIPEDDRHITVKSILKPHTIAFIGAITLYGYVNDLPTIIEANKESEENGNE